MEADLEEDLIEDVKKKILKECDAVADKMKDSEL
eukprot:CAMPEP_0114602680 /NCGR_PEP_ID=MMETSP0125-20121206/25254_1 /TAXON_ID=485358 ORGANISM="Aristerostoma sp., Strain ATCC 50986" /NCGR_SAMPLE_ID=MMETSP0125 /ASSEMBLY_ACC=CAM_ASM_000245 /LENGTH=33 /DNA_ID= /DNA_START= /DNA_END= /DNA_ORIENTATION=